MMKKPFLKSRKWKIVLPMVLVLGLVCSVIVARSAHGHDSGDVPECCKHKKEMSCGMKSHKECLVTLENPGKLPETEEDHRAEIHWPRHEKVD